LAAASQSNHWAAQQMTGCCRVRQMVMNRRRRRRAVTGAAKRQAAALHIGRKATGKVRLTKAVRLFIGHFPMPPPFRCRR
jgi:hypothetical protein